MIRAFLAVELSEDLRRQITKVQQDLKQRLVGDGSKDIRISWVQPGSIHLTIKFLGELDEEIVDSLREALSNLMKAHYRIQIPIEGLGVFPHLRQPRVLWVGPSELWERGEDAKRLSALHRAVEGCCQSFGFAPEDRSLSPHLTLARIKAGERQLAQTLSQLGIMDRPLAVGPLGVNSLVLMKSELRPTGSAYTRLWELLMSE